MGISHNASLKRFLDDEKDMRKEWESMEKTRDRNLKNDGKVMGRNGNKMRKNEEREKDKRDCPFGRK